MHAVKAYFNYLLTSKNQYGVHSPFLFDYLTKGLSGKSILDFSKARQFRKELDQSRESVIVQDFGAGSKVFKGNKRSVSKIAKNAGISKKRAKLLAKTLHYFRPENVLEIGTSLGISTAYMSIGAPEAKITTLEGCSSTAGVAKKQFEKFKMNNIKVVEGKFDKTLDLVLKNQQYDLIFFDGNHQKRPTIEYFEKCLKAAHEDSIFIFDDIHWSVEMEEAWEYIKNHGSVKLSVDTFKWGLVFFHTGREKQHFTLRL
ncbi:class I SAM-dependent methyltransferase [Lutimonas saemankumensis]|uniref:O-methyltransferase n=1 Tax=Lutimonas saemankumensis TaxID=483016 RepID=UPI001CD354D7|nr:class I SAM-dependent methyltransferase [Lutimonas saemankumensis]MCA0931458.1 class I SAM-dependent methyltransferase [Lutimonas saemankumensis]